MKKIILFFCANIFFFFVIDHININNSWITEVKKIEGIIFSIYLLSSYYNIPVSKRILQLDFHQLLLLEYLQRAKRSKESPFYSHAYGTWDEPAIPTPMLLTAYVSEIIFISHFFPPFQHLLSERRSLSDSKFWTHRSA